VFGNKLWELRVVYKGFVELEHYYGDEQTPDQVCTNCKAVYQFRRFENANKKMSKKKVGSKHK